MLKTVATTGFACAILGVATLTLMDVSDIRGRLPLMDATKSFDGGEKTATWDDADCIVRSVTTKQGDGEPLAEFCARHDAAVAHDMQVYGVKGQLDIAVPGDNPTWLSWYLKRHPEKIVEDTPWRK